MKNVFFSFLLGMVIFSCKNSKIEMASREYFPETKKQLFIDVHHLGAGNVTAEAVAEAHVKDLAVEGKYGVNFLEYWVNEETGIVYCLSETADSSNISKTHAEAHGLIPDEVFMVSDGKEGRIKGNSKLFLDIHDLGAGNVTAEAVAEVHAKDLEVEGKYGVNFINYWVDEANGKVYCLSESPNAESVTQTHAEAHGLLPNEIEEIKLGK